MSKRREDLVRDYRCNRKHRQNTCRGPAGQRRKSARDRPGHEPACAVNSEGRRGLCADLTDAPKLTKAFEGAKGVYAMIPPNPAAPDVRGYQKRVSDALTSALSEASVPHAVVLSSVGADKAEKTGPVVGLHNLEQQLNEIPGLHAVYLRAGYFMENLLPQADAIRSFGQMGGRIRSDLRLSFIATRDIAARAAAILHKRDFTGKQARELLGQRDLTYTEAASVIGKAIGKSDLTYTQLPQEQLKALLTQMGMSANMADLLLEMAEALNSGYMRALEPRSAENTTATSIEQFAAEQFVPAFSGMSAKA
ncbi:MAG: NmrA family NAD(P)-binding protein [Bryobacteraceae bacterium]